MRVKRSRAAQQSPAGQPFPYAGVATGAGKGLCVEGAHSADTYTVECGNRYRHRAGDSKGALGSTGYALLGHERRAASVSHARAWRRGSVFLGQQQLFQQHGQGGAFVFGERLDQFALGGQVVAHGLLDHGQPLRGQSDDHAAAVVRIRGAQH